MKQSQYVGLPKEVDPEEYCIYYTTSSNEASIIMRKNVM